LLVASKKGSGFSDVGLLGKSFSPRSIIRSDRMILGKIKNDCYGFDG
jgi:hypothetical protein